MDNSNEFKISHERFEQILDDAHSYAYIKGYQQCLRDIEDKFRITLIDLHCNVDELIKNTSNNTDKENSNDKD